MSDDAREPGREARWWSRLEEVELRERRERFRSTTPAERIRHACELSDLGLRLRGGMPGMPVDR